MQNKRKGALYGQAIGDALGAFYEFSGQLKPGEKARYMDTRQGFKAGEWTDDTDQAIVLIKAFTLAPDDMPAAARLCASGFQTWLANDGRDCGFLTSDVLNHPAYASEPLQVAEEIWEKGGKKSAPNGSVMRAVGVPLVRPWDPVWILEAASVGCRTTHADPRCVASTLAMSVACAALLKGAGIKGALQQGIAAGYAVTPGIAKYLTMSLKDLDLNGEGVGYTFKCVGAGFWALREFQRRDDECYDDMWPDRFEDILNDIIREHGDTDTNAAVAGALMGAYIGFDNLPPALVAGLQRKQELDDLLAKLPKVP